MDENDDDPRDETMSHADYVRATFFTSDADVRAPIAKPAKHRIARRTPELRALAVFSRALETQSPEARYASIRWLARRFLGGRW